MASGKISLGRQRVTELSCVLIADVLLLVLMLALKAEALRARVFEDVNESIVMGAGSLYAVIIGIVLAAWGAWRSAQASVTRRERAAMLLYLLAFLTMLALYLFIFALYMGWANTGGQAMRKK